MFYRIDLDIYWDEDFLFSYYGNNPATFVKNLNIENDYIFLGLKESPHMVTEFLSAKSRQGYVLKDSWFERSEDVYRNIILWVVLERGT